MTNAGKFFRWINEKGGLSRSKYFALTREQKQRLLFDFNNQSETIITAEDLDARFVEMFTSHDRAELTEKINQYVDQSGMNIVDVSICRENNLYHAMVVFETRRR